MRQNLSKEISIFAPAKINLYLHITGKRDDGFHLLDSLVAFADYGDQISVKPAEHLTLTIKGPFSNGLSTGGDNLVLKAAYLLADFIGLKAKADITLSKNLPVASGIGGGSADAAATLLALAELWRISPSLQDLMGLAENLGSDVPVCLTRTPSFISGIGEKIAPAPALPDTWLVLVNPNTPVSTPEVFAQRKGDFSSPQPFNKKVKSAIEFANLLAGYQNSLTSAAIFNAAVIQDVLIVLEEVPGQLLTRLSGSGATCFSIFATKDEADSAAISLQMKYPHWWIKSVTLGS